MGETVTTWEQALIVWGGIRPVRGREIDDSDHAITAYDYVITMRALLSMRLDITHRIVALATGHIYDITAVVNVDERNRMLEARCLQGASLG